MVLRCWECNVDVVYEVELKSNVNGEEKANEQTKIGVYTAHLVGPLSNPVQVIVQTLWDPGNNF